MTHSTSHSLTKAGPNPVDDHDRDLDTVNESTPLLCDGDEEAVSSRKREPTPLPKAQLGALLVVRIVDPIAYQQIFPYINQLLADMRVAEPERVGFYSGLVESAYSLAQMFSVYQWGKISDIVGRRPVVFTGVVGIALTTIAFGLSTSFAGIMMSRFFGGLVAGNIAVIHSILAEITDDSNQDLAVPIYSLSWPLGTVIGPLIGGVFENAATRYPRFFSWQIFIEHPYLPPCVISAACALVGAVLGYTVIEETLPSKRKNLHRTGTHSSSLSGEHSNGDSDNAKPASAMELFSVPAIRALIISGFALSFLSLAFDVVFTLFCYTPIDAGGLGLEPSTIGNVLSSAGVLTVILRLSVMSYVLRRFDYAKTYNACMYLWPIAFGLVPFLNLFARAYPPSSSNTASAFTWASLLGLLFLSKIGMIPHSLSMLLVKRHVPSPSSLGQSNGLVQFAMCVGRTMAPMVVSTLFTGVNGLEWARRWGLGWTWAVVMVVGSIAGARVTRGVESRPRGD